MNAAVIQARMGSSRLPGKVLKKFGTSTILDSVVERVKRSTAVEQVIVATTELPIDDSIFFHCKDRSINVTRGPELDVLLRFISSLGENFQGNVLRITADCPFIDSSLIDLAYAKFMDLELDYIGIATGAGVANTNSNKYPDGVDAEWFKYEALLKANTESTHQLDREHVTSFIWRNPNRFKIGQLAPLQNYSDVSLTVDTAEDFENMTNLVRLLGDDYLEADFPLVIDKYRIGVVTGRLRPPIKNSNYEVFYKHEN
jgi:spore coat polysaccharide biosynthesis protein SpsF